MYDLCELVPTVETTPETEEAVTPSISGLQVDYHPAYVQVPAARSRVLSGRGFSTPVNWHTSGDVGRSVANSVARVAETPR